MKDALSPKVLLIGGIQLWLGLTAPAADEQKAAQPAAAGIAEIERDLQGHLGVAILDTANNKSIEYHATDRFPSAAHSSVCWPRMFWKESTNRKSSSIANRLRPGRPVRMGASDQATCSGREHDRRCTLRCGDGVQ